MFVSVWWLLSLQQCSKESIHQLVLNAENLVREEVFLQQKIQQQQLPLSRRHHSHPQQPTYYRQFSSPVLTTPPTTSAKCNGGSNYHRSDVAAGVAIHTMKVTNSAPAKKLSSINGGGGVSGGGARKCDQLKIKLVQVRLPAAPPCHVPSTCSKMDGWMDGLIYGPSKNNWWRSK